MSRDMLGYLLKRQLLVVRLLFALVLLVFLLLVPVMFGEEGQERIAELPLVVTRVFQQVIQLYQVGYPKIETLQEHQGGKQDGGQPDHLTKSTNYIQTNPLGTGSFAP